jgi:hypothetical protein
MRPAATLKAPAMMRREGTVCHGILCLVCLIVVGGSGEVWQRREGDGVEDETFFNLKFLSPTPANNHPLNEPSRHRAHEISILDAFTVIEFPCTTISHQTPQSHTMGSSDNREPKRLRSIEPDLKVIVGSGDDVSTQWHHAASLALKSKYVDTMLSTPMREQETRTITFPDISPSTWDKMNKFLDDPKAARKMTVSDVKNVVFIYDKYEFNQGCELCEDVILDYFKSVWELEKSHKLDLDMVIDLTVIAHEANLALAFEEGMSYLLRKMNAGDYGSPIKGYGRMMFTEKRLNRIFPLMKHYTISSYDTKSIIRIVNRGNNMTVEQALEQSAAVRTFANWCNYRHHTDYLQKCISHFELYGTNSKADGTFGGNGHWPGRRYQGGDRTARWGRQTVQFEIQCIERNGEDVWAVVRCTPPPDDDDEVQYQICWYAPYSGNMSFPPMIGWVPDDVFASGYPKLKYILHESIG